MRMALSTLSRARTRKKQTTSADRRRLSRWLFGISRLSAPFGTRVPARSGCLWLLRQSTAGFFRSLKRSAVKRNEQTQSASDGDVVHHLFQTELHALLLMDGVTDVPAQGEPFGQVELHAWAKRTGQTGDRWLDRRSSADRQVEVVTADPAAHPTHLAVSHGPDQVAHEKLHGVVLGASDADQVLLPVDDRVQDLVVLPRAQVAGLETEIFSEVESIGAAVGRRAIGDVASEPTAHGGQLVAQRLFDQARHDTAIGALTDQLLLERLIHALRRCSRRPAEQNERAQREYEQGMGGTTEQQVVPPDIIEATPFGETSARHSRTTGRLPDKPATHCVFADKTRSTTRTHSTRASLTFLRCPASDSVGSRYLQRFQRAVRRPSLRH